MGKFKVIYLGALFALLLAVAPKAFSMIGTFDSATGAAINFTGNDTKFLQVANSSNLKMLDDNFTISWWQKTTAQQYRFPRILQFGHGSSYSDKFAISEEEDGKIYLWINGINISSMSQPSNFSWHHITVMRQGFDYTWFLDGNPVSTNNFVSDIPCDGCLSRFALFDTSGLDLLIGAGDDPTRAHPSETNLDGTPKLIGTGSFYGELTGFQISQTAKWNSQESFTPPSNFLNPGTGFAFSMYVSETEVLDKSLSNLIVTPIALTAGEFSDFSPTNPAPSSSPTSGPTDSPSPTPDPSPSPTPDPSPSPTPDPSPSSTPDPEPIRHEVSARVFAGQGGTITADTDSWTENANVMDVEQEFWVEGNETFTIHIFPSRGYDVESILWNGVEEEDPDFWNGSLNFISSSNLNENVNLVIKFRLIQMRSSISSALGNNQFRFNEDFTISARSGAPENNYWGVDGLIMAFPININSPELGTFQTTCYMDLNPFWEMDPPPAYAEIGLWLPNFSRFVSEFFPHDCIFPTSPDYDSDFSLEEYTPGMLGVESVTAQLGLSPLKPDDITDFSGMAEIIPITFLLPPDIVSHSVISRDPSKFVNGKINLGDTLTVQLSNTSGHGELEMVVILPEALPVNPDMPANFCFITLTADETNSVLIPAEAEFISECRIQWNGDWDFDRYQDHQAYFTFWGDNDNNGSLLFLNVAALETLPTEESAPPSLPVSPPSPYISPSPPSPPIVENSKPVETKLEQEEIVTQPAPTAIPIVKPEVIKKPEANPIPTKIISAKKCLSQGVWVFTKSGLIQVCDSNLKVTLVSKACTGKSATPTFPWIFKAQRFKPGYTPTKSGQSLYFSVFFFKGLAIAGVDKVSSSPCSKGSVLTDKMSAQKIFYFLKKNNSPIWVRNI